jgi:hypothetical protein
MGALPLAVVLFLGGMGMPLVSSSRFAELEENSPAKTRLEELSIGHRLSPQRQLRNDVVRLAAHVFLSPRFLGHTQNPILNAPRGHRLPNGLLAPLTC